MSPDYERDRDWLLCTATALFFTLLLIVVVALVVR